MDFLPLAVQESFFFFFFVRILMMSKRGKLRAVFILKSGFHPSAVVGEEPWRESCIPPRLQSEKKKRKEAMKRKKKKVSG